MEVGRAWRGEKVTESLKITLRTSIQPANCGLEELGRRRPLPVSLCVVILLEHRLACFVLVPCRAHDTFSEHKH